jgi:hypothetical protein
MLPQLAGPFNAPSPFCDPAAGHQEGLSWPGAAAADGGPHQPPEPPTAGPPAPSLDDVIAQALAAVTADCSPLELDGHVRALCEALAGQRASAVVTNAALSKLNDRLAALKHRKLTQKAWDEKLREARATVAVANPAACGETTGDGLRAAVRDALPDAPVPAEVVVPAGWKVLAQGVFRAGAERDVEVLPVPLLIIARHLDCADQTEAVELAWQRDGRWKRFTCGRHEIATKRDITGLAGLGLPVTSLNADGVIAYLSDFEADNISVLPRIRVRKQLGWADGELSGFLWGHTWLGEGVGAAAATAPTPFGPPGGPAGGGQGAPGAGPVSFRGADAGDEQAAAGYHAGGTFEGWRAAAGPALLHPRVRLVLTASLAAPLLPLLGARNFIVDVAGETSTGKTTVLRLAASAWGLPDENSEASVMSTWNTTRVGAERRAGLVNGLPIVRDDHKLARRPEDVSQFLYDVTSGRTRDRGTVKGLDRTTAFSTVLLTSGESRAVSTSGDGGTRARVLTLWGAPFGRTDQETAKLVNGLNAGAQAHYGHAGPRLVQFLLANRHRWGEWRERYAALRSDYLGRAQGNAVVGRLAEAFAVLTLAGELAAEALGMPLLKQAPVEELWGALTDEAAEADRAGQALAFAWDWACSHTDQFFDPADTSRGERGRFVPVSGWAGHWAGCRRGWAGWQFVGFIPARLCAVLKEGGFDADGVLSTWKDRGWLHVDPSDPAGKHHQAVIDGHKPRVLAVRRAALREAGCLRDDDGPAEYLLRVAKSFLDAARHYAQTPGDAAKLNAAVEAVVVWLSSVRPGAGGVKGEEKPASGPSLAGVKGEEKTAPGPSLAGVQGEVKPAPGPSLAE